MKWTKMILQVTSLGVSMFFLQGYPDLGKMIFLEHSVHIETIH
jgi:hypothetical protein